MRLDLLDCRLVKNDIKSCDNLGCRAPHGVTLIYRLGFDMTTEETSCHSSHAPPLHVLTSKHQIIYFQPVAILLLYLPSSQ